MVFCTTQTLHGAPSLLLLLLLLPSCAGILHQPHCRCELDAD
jgi:hypothetical protein